MQTHTPLNQAGLHDAVSVASADGSDVWDDTAAVGPPRLFTADDVASVLGVPRTFVYALSRRGDLPTVRVGERYVRYRAEALERWIAARESTARRGLQ
jgi:excisionase family DNA binding protein